MSTKFDLAFARPPRSFGPRRRSPRAFAVLSVLIFGGVGLGAADNVPALAWSVLPASSGTAPKGPKRLDAAQAYTVPASVESEIPQRRIEVVALPAEWIAPVTGELRDGFGPRPIAPVAGVSRFHSGEDIGAPCGAPVRAATAGRVIEAGWDGSYGNRVVLQSKAGVQTVYAHASRLLVETGTIVTPGARIADVGTSGASTGCHLHFEVHVQARAVDPAAFLLRRGVRLGG